VIKQSKIRKKTVELHAPARPSRIRRDPVRTAEEERLARNAWWDSREWEIRLALVGIVFFAIAIAAAVIDIGEVLSQ
jgi:hypothetical protein